MRTLFLIAFLACELLAVYLLRTRGWTATGDLMRLILALVVALLPLVGAIVVLFLRGRKFSLRSMMIATALFAVFISLILYPFAQVRNRRAGVMALEAAQIHYETRSQPGRCL